MKEDSDSVPEDSVCVVLMSERVDWHGTTGEIDDKSDHLARMNAFRWRMHAFAERVNAWPEQNALLPEDSAPNGSCTTAVGNEPGFRAVMVNQPEL
jgi:hypothetical protein